MVTGQKLVKKGQKWIVTFAPTGDPANRHIFGNEMGNLSSLTYNYIKMPMPKKGIKQDTLKKGQRKRHAYLQRQKEVNWKL